MIRWPPALWERLTRLAGPGKRSEVIHRAVERELDRIERQAKKQPEGSGDA